MFREKIGLWIGVIKQPPDNSLQGTKHVNKG